MAAGGRRGRRKSRAESRPCRWRRLRASPSTTTTGPRQILFAGSMLLSPDLVLTAIANLNRDSPDELGSGANCSDFLDCLELPTRGKGDFRHSRLLHAVRGSV